MRRFRVLATTCHLGQNDYPLMTGIQIDIPEHIQLDIPDPKSGYKFDPETGMGRSANPEAVKYVVEEITKEFFRYGAHECLLTLAQIK